MMNEYSEAAKKVLPNLIKQGLITEEQSKTLLRDIRILEQQNDYK